MVIKPRLEMGRNIVQAQDNEFPPGLGHDIAASGKEMAATKIVPLARKPSNMTGFRFARAR